MTPYVLYSNGNGNIFEDTSLYVVGRSGWDAMPIPEEDWIELPDGGSLYELPAGVRRSGRSLIRKPYAPTEVTSWIGARWKGANRKSEF